MRKSGILLPVSSLPSRYGIGTFSKEAYTFVDFLAEAGQSLWQILPLGPTGYGDSPYQSFSTFAGNPYYIDLEEFIRKGWLSRRECNACDFGDNDSYVDYEKIYRARFGLLKKACERCRPREDEDFLAFLEENSFWLPDYALFMAIKDSLGGICWIEWPEELKKRRAKALRECRQKLDPEILCYEFEQYMFAKQWQALKAYANGKGIEIVGDIPIYVSMDSADAWADPRLFQLDETCTPTAVAGCPPDGFSATGQLWGNPLYRWEYHKKTGYAWWIRRLEYCFRLYDVVRIDHFRGFDEYYAIPYGHATAEFGKWQEGPGYGLFAALHRALGDKAIIAEDLGFLTPSVLELLERSGYPGMKVLHFAFGDGAGNAYLPHNYKSNCVVYTGTHDNDTSAHWYETLEEAQRVQVDAYLGLSSGRRIAGKDNAGKSGRDGRRASRALIRAAMASVADTAIIPLQDYLGLGGEARINTPSTLGDNWKWRMKKGCLIKKLAAEIRELTGLYGRLQNPGN